MWSRNVITKEGSTGEGGGSSANIKLKRGLCACISMVDPEKGQPKKFWEGVGTFFTHVDQDRSYGIEKGIRGKKITFKRGGGRSEDDQRGPGDTGKKNSLPAKSNRSGSIPGSTKGMVPLTHKGYCILGGTNNG